MTKHDDAILFHHMLDAARKAMDFSRGRRREDLDNEEIYALAIARLLTILGEAAAKISAEGQDSAQNIPWRLIIGTRNRLIHGYAEVDPDIVWTIIEHDLQPLIRDLERLVSEDPA